MQLNRPLSVITPTVDGDVLTVLARTQRFLTAGEVHRMVDRWSVNGVRNAVIRLCTEGLVTADRSGPVPRYALNREHLAAGPVIELAHLPRLLASRLRRELEDWEETPAYAALLDGSLRADGGSARTLDLFLIRPGTVDRGSDAWARDVEALRQAASGWTGSEVRILELSEREVLQGRHGDLVAEVRRAGTALVGDELLVWRRPGGRTSVTDQ